MIQAQEQQTPLKHRPRGKPWPRGVSGNPAGRPKGALNKFSLAVRGETLAVNGQAEPTPAPEPVMCDFRRGHVHSTHKINGVWRRTVEQDGLVFDRDTGTLITEDFEDVSR